MMCSLSHLYVFCALFLSLTACSRIAIPDKGSTPIASTILPLGENPQDIVVIGEANGAPIGCSPNDIAARIAKMFAAITHGDPTIVDEFFGRKSSAPFSWFTVEGGFEAYNLDELESVLQQRYQQHERLYLQSIQFNGWDPGRGLVHFGPVVVARSADDLQSVPDGSPQILDGKGAYHCTTQAIVVLSLGPP